MNGRKLRCPGSRHIVIFAAVGCLVAMLSASAWRSSPSPAAAQGGDAVIYFPFAATVCHQPAGQTLPLPKVYSSSNAVNFSQAAADLNQQGLTLVHNKIGFHTGVGGNRNGIGDAFRQLDQSGVPIVLKSADDAGPVAEVIELAKASGVPHIAIFRRTGPGSDEFGSFNYDTPDYSLSPKAAAERHWMRHMRSLPPELYADRHMFWLETVNEVDKSRSVWLAEFATETAQLALRDGFNWAAFGWSSGEPEPEHWRSPQMLQFLRLVANNSDRLAIAIHEYSYEKDDIQNIYPYLIGRFHDLFAAADENKIPRPAVLITEWGWEYQNIPLHSQAMSDIEWAARLYAAYPQIKGAAIWYLGGGYGSIHDQTQGLIAPMADYATQTYFGIVPGQGCLNPEIFLR